MDKIKELKNKLRDERSNKVVFVSHCLLNENTRYLGGAFRKGCVDEIVDELQSNGFGIIQMKCPEQKAWGGILKPTMWIALGLKKSKLYKLNWLFFPIFVWNTKRVYTSLAKKVVHEIKENINSGIKVVGILGVDSSPSCGVNNTLGLKASFEYFVNSNLDSIDKKEMNAYFSDKCKCAGQGLFIKALKKELKKNGLNTPFYGRDLFKEINKQSKIF